MKMDKIKGFINDLTGGDGNELKGTAEDAGLGDLTGKLENLDIGSFDISALSRLDFPLDKTEIISTVKSAGVSEQLVSMLDKIPDQIYETLEDLQMKLPI